MHAISIRAHRLLTAVYHPLNIVGFTDEVTEVDYTEVVDHPKDEKRKLNNERYQEGENNVVITLCPV